jgi:hypothetical protein
MAKFITGEELEKVIYDIIWEAEKTLFLVSPFVKLDDYFKKLHFSPNIIKTHHNMSLYD